MNIRNHVSLIGNITHELEKKEFNGRSFLSFQIAVSNVWTDKTGQVKSSVTFVGVSAWGKIADNITKDFTKGSGLKIVGELRTSSWEHDGAKRYRTFVLADMVLPYSAPVVKAEKVFEEPAPDPDIIDPEDIPF